MFLLHPIFMQTVLPVFAFRNTSLEYPSDPPVLDDKGLPKIVLRHPQRGLFMIWVGVLVAMGMCIAVSHVWVERVEPVFAGVAGWCEGVMVGRRGERGERLGYVLPVGGGDLQKMGARHGNGVLTPPRERSLTPPLLESLTVFEREREKEIGRIA